MLETFFSDQNKAVASDLENYKILRFNFTFDRTKTLVVIIFFFYTIFRFIIGCNVGLVDPIVRIAIIMFVIGISYELNDVDFMVIRIDIRNRIEYNRDVMTGITVMSTSYICGIFIGILIETIFLKKIVSHLNKVSTIERVCGNDSNTTIIMNTIYKFCNVAIVVGGILIVIDFVTQLIDRLSLNIILLIEFGANIDFFAPLILRVTVQVSNSVDYRYTQVILTNGYRYNHNVFKNSLYSHNFNYSSDNIRTVLSSINWMNTNANVITTDNGYSEN